MSEINMRKLTLTPAKTIVLCEALRSAAARLPEAMRPIYHGTAVNARQSCMDRTYLTDAQVEITKHALDLYLKSHPGHAAAVEMLAQLTLTRAAFKSYMALQQLAMAS